MPKVTIIIPSYNCEAYIAETIGSVLDQTLKDIELIVVDDGSTDRTREIVQGFGEPVRLIAQQNQRVCAARNRGIREAKGEFICLLDHDDYWYPYKLESQVEALEQHREAMVAYAPFIRWYQDAAGNFPDPSTLMPPQSMEGIDIDGSGWIYHQFLLDCWMLTSSAMFRKEVFEKCGAFDEALPYSEDWDLWIRISREYQFIKLKRPNTLYRQHPQQGNLVVRDVDYRTVLLEKTIQKWGYCSQDGRCTPRDVFLKTLAGYHAGYGLHHLQAGNISTASKSFLQAWKNDPMKLKYFAYILAGWAGWRPKW